MVERSNALVYLMIRALELKVEGSNPAVSRSFFESTKIWSDKNELIRELINSRVNAHAQ